MPPYWLLGAFASGIAFASLSPGPVSPLVVGCCATLLLVSWLLLRRRSSAWLPLLIATTLCGFLLTHKALLTPDDSAHISRFTGDDQIIVEARLINQEKTANHGVRALLECGKIIKANLATIVHGRLLLTIESGELLARPGQMIRFRARIRAPQRFGTPGEFDYPLHLASREIYATSFAERGQDILVLPRHPAAQNSFGQETRHTLAERIDQAVDPQLAPLVKALAIGMRAEVSNDQRRLLSESGVAHLFAISGLHFGLLGYLLYLGSSWLYRRSQRLILLLPPRRVLPLLLVAPLGGYLCLTGSSWSATRAFCMAALAAALLVGYRRTPPLAMLATTALVLLIFSPLALLQPGFQLSFAGLAGILRWMPGWQQRISGLSHLFRWPVTIMLTTTAATLATAPFILWHFHQLSPAGIPANLLAIPPIAWGVVPACLLASTISGLAPHLSDLTFQLAGAIIDLTLDAVGWIAELPGMAPVYYPLTQGEMLCLGALLFSLLWHPNGHRQRQLRHGLPIVALLAAVLSASSPHDGLRVIALAVGQGDATLVTLPGNRHYLVDGGGLPGSTIDVGERLVAPALGRFGIHHLDGIILTHDHPDHRDGLASVIDLLPVDNFWSALPPQELHPVLSSRLTSRGVPIHQLQEGWQQLPVSAGEGFTLFIPNQQARDLNNRSVVVMASDQHNRVLLSADLGPDGLHQLLANHQTEPVNLLKISHHGSRHSAPDAFLAAFQPELAFASAGRNNTYGFPHPATLDSFNQAQVKVLRTDQDGTLVFSSTSDGWQVETSL